MIIVNSYEVSGQEYSVDLRLECDTCLCYEKYPETLFFSNEFERDVLNEIQGGTWWDWWHYVSGKLVCETCYDKLCLHHHPVDNHRCMRYSGHEGDHECCRHHMYY